MSDFDAPSRIQASLDELVRALAHNARRQILRGCRGRFVPAGELAAQLALAPASVSEHLKVLRKTGLVELRRIGTSWTYRAQEQRIADVVAALTRELEPQEEQ
ncbi:MAG TPA: helix-turn-helix transcriptional regulator [Acidimicrobiales bacterium]